MAEKEKELQRIKQRLDYMEKNLMSGESAMVQNMEGIANIEAQLEFTKNEKNELADKLDVVQKNSHQEIIRLNEELDELRDKYNEARQEAVAVEIFKKKL